MERAGPDRLSFLGTRLPLAFELLVVPLRPGRERAFAAAEWLDAVVVVERGAIELEDARGRRARFERGAVICLSGLPLRVLRNGGAELAVLSVVRRRRAVSP